MRDGIDDDGRVDLRVGIAFVEQSRLEEDSRRVEANQIERTVLAEHDSPIDLALREQRRVLFHDDVRHDSGWSFLDEESDSHFVGAAGDDRGIYVGFAIASLPVEHADAQYVALELLVIEVLLGEEVFRLADPAERRQDEAVAV